MKVVKVRYQAFQQDCSFPGSPGMVPGRDRTGRDLETLKVPWSRGPRTKEVQKSRDFFRRSRDPPSPFLQNTEDTGIPSNASYSFSKIGGLNWGFCSKNLNSFSTPVLFIPLEGFFRPGFFQCTFQSFVKCLFHRDIRLHTNELSKKMGWLIYISITVIRYQIVSNHRYNIAVLK